MSMLKVENLSVHYGMIQAVRDVSFEVNEGGSCLPYRCQRCWEDIHSSNHFRFGSSKFWEDRVLGQEIQNVPAQKIVAAGLSKFQKDATSFQA